MKILIVDDEPVSREILNKIVSGPGAHQVTAVEDAKSAWALLDDPARYFDVAFLDLSMPGEDGFQLLYRIRRNPLLASMEVVICTGAKDRASLTKAIQLGARHYLIKPVTKEIVMAKLNQIRPSEAVADRPLAAEA